MPVIAPARSMRLQGYSNIYLLISLLVLFSTVNAQNAGGNETDVDNGNDTDDHELTRLDVKLEVLKIMACIMNTKIIGPLFVHVDQFFNVFVSLIPPSLRSIFIRYLQTWFALVVDMFLAFRHHLNEIAHLGLSLLGQVHRS